MARRGSSLRGVTLLVGSNAATAAAQFSVFAAASWYGSTREAGEYAFAFALTAPVYFLVSLKLRAVVATDIGSEFRPSEYLALRLLAALGFLALFAGVAITGPDGASRWIIVNLAVIRAAELVSDLSYGRLQAQSRFGTIAASQTARVVASAGASVTALALGTSMATALIPAIAIGAVGAAVDSLILAPVGRPVVAASRVWLLTRRTLPLGVSLALASLSLNIPRYSLRAHEGPEAVALFSGASYFLMVGALVINAVGQIAAPRLATFAQERNAQAFNAYLQKLTLAGVALAGAQAALFAAAGSALLGLVLGDDYRSAGPALVILALAAVCSYSAVFLGNGLTAVRRFTVQLPISIVGVGVVAAVSVALTPHLGLNGAAAAVLAGAASEAIASWALVHRTLSRQLGAPH